VGGAGKREEGERREGGEEDGEGGRFRGKEGRKSDLRAEVLWYVIYMCVCVSNE